MATENITFVISFFNIGRRTDAHMQKFDNYFAWIEELLKLPINIYFFASPDRQSTLLKLWIKLIPY